MTEINFVTDYNLQEVRQWEHISAEALVYIHSFPIDIFKLLHFQTTWGYLKKSRSFD